MGGCMSDDCGESELWIPHPFRRPIQWLKRTFVMRALRRMGGWIAENMIFDVTNKGAIVFVIVTLLLIGLLIWVFLCWIPNVTPMS